ncbi:hypothetical protein RhiLY_14497 [Ceratobasidium sp. AG-Ba]|nr:hypothetical protein RhiLY_14497 [Ceratobasidium sp. AG-Ba]
MSHQSEDSHFSNASTVCKQRSKFEIWAYEVSADVVRRTRPSTGPLAELYQNSQRNAVIDSGTFLLNVPDGHEYRTAFFAAKELPGLICTVNKAPRLELAHWIVEYEKSEDQLKSVERQVYYGMVSSLWQRRALGYMDQFVFATAHVGQQLTVYAATWEEGTLKNPAPSRAGSDPGVTRGTSTRSTRSSTGSRRSPAPQGESDGPRPLLQSLNPQERQYKIVVYELAEYQTTKFYDMLHYYYLLRASRKLADEYREKIFQDKLPLFEERVKRLRRYDWPAKDNDNNTAEGSTRTGMPSLPEEPGPSGTQHAICVADPEEEASWKSEWDRERTKAFETCGFGSLTDFKIPECEMEADLDDGLYLE